jgi:hypothetical protein
MSTTTIAKRPRWMRLSQDAKLIPVERVQEWHDRAVMTPGLRELERAILAAIVEWYRRLRAWDHGFVVVPEAGGAPRYRCGQCAVGGRALG